MKEGFGYGNVLDIISQVMAEHEVTNEEAIIISSMMHHALVSEEWRLLTEAMKEAQRKAQEKQTSPGTPAKL
jgi:hypothetical protein